ncbi:MAG TPA: polysaccharide biosynthesis protein [Firmicutes bacterium]|nr:polysaccharide biosynthesis protein [Bacillota bacterium]
MPKQEKQSFLHGALILSAAAILTKIIGALFFKIPLQNINQTAYGYFDAAYNIYIPLYTVSTAGFPIAVSRLVSESLALGRFRDIRVIHRVANRIFFITGTIGTVIMFAAAFLYPNFVHMPPVMLTMLMMAPSILFCCMVSAYRGVYEGSRNMYPTAISQILEAVGKLIVGLGLAAGALRLGQWQFEHGGVVFGKAAASAAEALEISLPYIAAGGMIGVTFGSFVSLAYLMLRYRLKGNGITREELLSAPRPYSSRRIFRRLLAFAIPVALGTLATQLTNLIDVVSLQKCLAVVVEHSGDAVRQMYAEEIAASGTTDILAYLTASRGIAMTYVNLVPNVTLTLGISALPVITSAWAMKNRPQLKKMVSVVLRITLLVALPSGIGLSLLAKPILNLIYDPVTASVAGPQLQVLGIAVVFICLTAPINSMLQAMGRADIPAKIVLLGGLVKLVLNIALVLQPGLNIMGSAYSTLACYVVMVLFSLAALRRVVGVRLNARMIFVRPLLAALLCGASAWGINALLSLWMPAKISTVVAILAAVVVYVFALFLFRAIAREDVQMLPKGEKIAQILEKHNWIG